MLLRQFSQKNTKVADIYTAQNTLAKTYHIVNQYDSLIALETKRQQGDLDRYSTQNGAYETDYQNYSKPGSPNTGSVRSNIDATSMPTISAGKEKVNSQLAAGIRGSNIDGDYYNPSRNFTSELNLTGIFLLLAYLVEILSFINFLVLVWRRPVVEVVMEEKVQ